MTRWKSDQKCLSFRCLHGEKWRVEIGGSKFTESGLPSRLSNSPSKILST